MGRVLKSATLDFSEDIPSDSIIVGALVRTIGYSDRVYAVVKSANKTVTCEIIGRTSIVNAFDDYVYVTLLYV